MKRIKWKIIKYNKRNLVNPDHECSRCFHVLASGEVAYKKSWKISVEDCYYYDTEIICRICYGRGMECAKIIKRKAQ